MNPARGNLKLAVTKPLPGDQLRCAIYARKSNEDDAADELKSVARQVAHARDYARAKGLAR